MSRLQVRRVVVSAARPEQAFAYLADFTTTERWDPGTVETVRLDGDGGTGTRYRNTSRLLGVRNVLTYTVVQLVPGELIELRAENASVIAVDRMTVSGTPGGGSEVVYLADLQFLGTARFLLPVLRLAFNRLADRAAAGMRQALDGLAGPGVPGSS